nr:4'-phosphopantetheinyl transferase superfamily protein [Streptomyces sp. NBC_00857]
MTRAVCVTGPDGPWGPVRSALADRGTVVVHSSVADWATAVPEQLERLLGHEAARHRTMAPAARARFAASRLLLKHAAATALDVRATDLELARSPGGRPYLRGCGTVDVSLSHTGGLVAVGLNLRGSMGVDAEPVSRTVHGTGVELRACIPRERAALERLPAHRRDLALLRLWTLKEAYTKALGTGLRLPFSSFGFALRPDGPPLLLRADGTRAPQDEWSFGSRVVRSGHVLGTATGRPMSFAVHSSRSGSRSGVFNSTA